MRISDWSSDVCSSDLTDMLVSAVVAGAGTRIQRVRHTDSARGCGIPGRGGSLPRGTLSRVQIAQHVIDKTHCADLTITTTTFPPADWHREYQIGRAHV